MKKNHPLSRRAFIKKASITASVLPLASYLSCSTTNTRAASDDLEVHVFSKHLQFLDYKEMAVTVKEIGYDGVDLTVRPKGHVLPKKVADDLPQAVAALREQGLIINMMTTGVNNSDDAIHRKVLETAAVQGIKNYRMGYLSYPKAGTIPEAIAVFQDQMKELAEFNQSLGLRGAYQNHAGKRVGAMMWDIYHLLEKANPDTLGCQYDIRHAMVEGGMSWETGLRLIQPHIHTIVLKDFVWQKVDGKWKVVNVPLGEGMVDFGGYFRILKDYGIQVPASMHLEYDLGGAEHGAKKMDKAGQKVVFEAMKRDLQKARKMWQEA